MKWYKEPYAKPYPGDEMVITKFAWIPIKCENGECAWLEKVNILEEYQIVGHEWVNKRFV